MADYIPVFVPSRVVTLTASGLVTGGDMLTVTGSGTVGPCPVDAAGNWVGVAAEDTTVNSPCTLYARGFVHEGLADGGVTAGDQLVTSGTAGRQVKALAAAVTATAADISDARAVIGIALTSGADAAKVRWVSI